MKCLACGAGLEYAGANKEYARCSHCCALFTVQNRRLTPMDVRTPAGNVDPEFTAVFAQQLGFAPRRPTHKVVGVGGMNLVVNTGKMERDLRNKIQQKVWGLIIGVIGTIVLIGLFIGLAVYMIGQMKSAQAGASSVPTAATGPAKTVSWDGKSPFTCGMSDNVVIQNVTANLASGPAITAGGACQLQLVNVNITAPSGISALANAKVTVKGGSIKASDEAIDALGSAQVAVDGAKITGKTSALGAAKITGVK
jgi:hypothetical protein